MGGGKGFPGRLVTMPALAIPTAPGGTTTAGGGGATIFAGGGGGASKPIAADAAPKRLAECAGCGALPFSCMKLQFMPDLQESFWKCLHRTVL